MQEFYPRHSVCFGIWEICALMERKLEARWGYQVARHTFFQQNGVHKAPVAAPTASCWVATVALQSVPGCTIALVLSPRTICLANLLESPSSSALFWPSLSFSFRNG